ncbi:MAG: pyridoxamine 5'-phosphate oxidase [Verrucomicrobiota bacterium]
MDLADYRRDYLQGAIRRADLCESPVAQFETWFEQATDSGMVEPNAMVLSTTSSAGQPSQRTVLLKTFDERGFVFYSNYESRKAREIAPNPQVSLLFPWIGLERQVIIQGRVEKISPDKSLRYFLSRPRESQLGAWVSQQSSVIENRAHLETKLAEIKSKFAGLAVPLPPFWGGYRVRPTSIEFWQGGSGRLHDRFLYTRKEDEWLIERLSP